VILWTIQYETFMSRLEQRGRVRARWREAESAWKSAYVWMARQTVERGCCRRPVAPIWAWHSCGAVGQGPDREVVEDYCGPNGRKVWLIEMEVPDGLVLLSHYGIWNDILEEVCVANGGKVIGAGGEEVPPDPPVGDWEQVFDIRLEDRTSWIDEGNRHAIQACVPYVDREWIRGIKRYQLPLMT